MSKPQTPDELVGQVSTLLEKYEVHDQALAIELAILITQREKTAMKNAYRNANETIDNVIKRSKL